MAIHLPTKLLVWMLAMHPCLLTSTHAAAQTQQINLSWSNVPHASKYTLEQEIQGTWTEIVRVDAASGSYTTTTLSLAPGSYRYRIGGCVTDGEGRVYCGSDVTEYSNSLDVTVAEITAPVTMVFRYDAQGRLYQVEDTVNGDRKYQYDAAGNRTATRIEEE